MGYNLILGQVIPCSHSRSLFRIGGALNSVRYNSAVLTPVVLSFIRALRNATFQQDNARPHIAVIVRIFLHTENVQLLPWSARSPDFKAIENVQSMVAERLFHQHMLVATVDVKPITTVLMPQNVCGMLLKMHRQLYLFIPSLNDSMSTHITAVVAAISVCSRY